MLGKLLKNEFIATGRIMGAVYAVVGVIIAYVLGSYYIGHDTASAGQTIGVAVLMLISMCNFILTTVVMVMNFQKSLYGEQGYLSFTLPVKSVTLFSSKVIVSTVWYIAAFVCLMGTAAITAMVLKEDLIGEESYSMIESLLPMFLNGKTVATLVTSMVVWLVAMFIRFMMFTVELYFAISLANTRKFQKKYTLWTIIFIVLTVGVSEKVAEFISSHISFGLEIVNNSIRLITDTSALQSGASFINLTQLIISLVIGGVFFYLTHYVMSKKVNIR